MATKDDIALLAAQEPTTFLIALGVAKHILTIHPMPAPRSDDVAQLAYLLAIQKKEAPDGK